MFVRIVVIVLVVASQSRSEEALMESVRVDGGEALVDFLRTPNVGVFEDEDLIVERASVRALDLGEREVRMLSQEYDTLTAVRVTASIDGYWELEFEEARSGRRVAAFEIKACREDHHDLILGFVVADDSDGRHGVLSLGVLRDSQVFELSRIPVPKWALPSGSVSALGWMRPVPIRWGLRRPHRVSTWSWNGPGTSLEADIKDLGEFDDRVTRSVGLTRTSDLWRISHRQWPEPIFHVTIQYVASVKEAAVPRRPVDTTWHAGWEKWWHFNRDRFVRIRSSQRWRRVHEVDESDRADAFDQLSESMSSEEPLPRSEVGASQIATPSEHLMILPVLLERCSGRSVSLRSITALGLLGRREAVPLLQRIASSSATLEDYESNQLQCRAVLALGLIGSVESAEILMDLATACADTQDQVSHRIGISAIIALGLFRAHKVRVQSFLVDFMQRMEVSPEVRGQVPISLMRLCEERKRGDLVELFCAKSNDRTTDKWTARACVIALGRLATLADERVAETLTSVCRTHPDDLTRHLAHISLGRIGSRDTPKEGVPRDARERVLEFLLGEVRNPPRFGHRPWAALAVAEYFLDANSNAYDTDVAQEARAVLQAQFEHTDERSHRDAIGLALGVLGAREVGQLLLDVILKEVGTKNTSSRGAKNRLHLAVALGFMGWEDAKGDLIRLLESGALSRGPASDVAIGAVLLGTRNQAVETIVKAVESGAAVGDIGAVVPRSATEQEVFCLVGLLEDEVATELARSAAAFLLGRLHNQETRLWPECVLEDSNYRGFETGSVLPAR